MKSLLRGLASYWPLHPEAAAVARANMLHPGVLDLTTGGTLALRSDIPAIMGADFDGVATANYLFVNDDARFSTADIDFTWCCWALPDVDHSEFVISQWLSAGNQRGFGIDLAGGATDMFGARHSTNGIADAVIRHTSFGAITYGVPYFLVAFYDAGANLVGIIVNGQSLDTVAAASIFNSTTQFRVGRSMDSANNFNGAISEVGIWFRLLTWQEIRWLYNKHRGRTWPFDGRPSDGIRGRIDNVGRRRWRESTGGLLTPWM